MKSDISIMSRSQNMKSYGRGKHSNHPNTVVHSSIQFDKFFCENSNKPTAAKSAGTIGKWGITSFTSIRSTGFTVGTKDSSRFSSLSKKRQQPAIDSGIQNKRPVLNNNIKRESSPVVQRKFFKSRNAADSSNPKSYKASNSPDTTTVKKSGRHLKSDENKKQKHAASHEENSVTRVVEKPLKISTKKITSPKIAEEDISPPDDFNKFQTLPSPPKERDKPPIVLRIFKGTSQLITDPVSKEESPRELDEPVIEPQDSLPVPEEPKEPLILSPPKQTISTRTHRRKSSESKSPSPEPAVSKPHRRHSEKSLSPDGSARNVKRRSPEKSVSPEPAITTRSLRRRAAPESVPQPPPMSPKRPLRSTRNTAATTGKIVIANLNSDHPTVYNVTEDTVPPTASPKRKDSKECRSYSNKHKHKSSKTEPPKVAEPETNMKHVEELLADLGTTPEHELPIETLPETKPPEVIDSDRQELLQLLEDDEEEPAGGNPFKNEPIAEPVQPTDLKLPVEESPPPPPSSNVVVNTESELKIKIKMSEIIKAAEPFEPLDEPEPLIPVACDSLDSGISVKSDDTSLPEDIIRNQSSEASEMKDSFGTTDSSDFEIKNDYSIPTAPAINKKGSIFKHRGSSDGNKKRLALYKHKWADDKDAPSNPDDDKNSNMNKNKALDSLLDSELEDMPLTKFIRQSNVDTFDFDDPGPVTGVKCPKKNKDYYTVVRNVKKAHQIQESGEFQEFNDDVEYILDALQDNNPIGTRCLSAITLATKCTEPAFRMHVRAHGTVTKFFRALHDATKDQSLGLCTATVMFVLSQDRLNMDLDRDSLELMLNLLESDASHTKALEDCGLTDSQLTKNRDRVRQICADIQAQGHAKHLNLDNITVGHLSMETLLSLTSKRAGEWFKEELRELGGLEHIIKTVVECCKHVDDTANAWSTTALDKIRKVDRCLRVLENVTMQNEQNNYYLLEYQEGILIDTLVKMYKVCDYEIPLYPTDSINDKDSTGAVLRECLIANLKVLLNITHDYQSKTHGSVIIGSRPGVIESSLHVLLQVPQYIPKEEKFDLMLLTLIMLINLVEHCDSNRKAILDAKAPSDEESIFETKAKEPAVKALIAMFYNHEEFARNEEKKTDAILEGENAEKPPTNAPTKVHEEFIEETISMLVQKAGQNMEHTLIAAYVAMLIGYLIIDNEEYEKFVRNHLPEKNFQFMISVLQKFYSFMTLTASGGTVSNRGMKSVQMVIQKLIDSDARYGFSSDPSLSTQQTAKPLDLNADSNSGDKNCNPLPSKFCESQNTVNMAISAS